MSILKLLLLFFGWVSDHFNFQSIFTPFSSVNRVTIFDGTNPGRGVTDYYVFCFRVGRIHKTVPWLNK